MYGTSDVIVPPDSIREFYSKVNSADKKLCSFDGYYHEIFNEVGKEAVYKVLFSWLASRVPKGMSEQAATE
jgi:alpha-beta hydrolase superfamily lysophospholipase